ncbi:MAG: glycosyltransferase, partial [Planctomycetota bacterium]
LERYAAKRCHTIVGVADAMNKAMLDAGIGKADQYETVYSGMATGAFTSAVDQRPAVRQELRLADDDVAVVTVARLFDMKGHDDLLSHAERLCRQHANLRFVWVGDGSLRPRFERQIAEMGLQDRFRLVGLVPPEDVPRYVAACDVLAHPSRREGLARALPQGQLARLPVVTYDIDGNAEGLVPGESGFAVPAFDVDAFIARISDLVRDAQRRHAMGEAGQAFAVNRFSTETMVRRLEDVYRRDVG